MKSHLFLTLFATTVCATGTPKLPNHDENKVPPYSLPDSLLCIDGTRARDVATWRAKRRPELLELFSREVYGRTPTTFSGKLRWKVTSFDPLALSGKAVRREVTVWFTDKDDGPRMFVLIYQPPGKPRAHAPWPAFLGLNFGGNHTIQLDPGITLSPAWMRNDEARGILNHRATAASRGASASSWPVLDILGRGYAVATIYCGDLCPDTKAGLANPAGIAPLFSSTPGADERAGDAWGAIGVWAWGLSRALDYFQNDPEIDARRVAVIGHSRLGKAALWAGAQDERFALVISNNSGCGGAALSKRLFGETVGIINQKFPHWFSKNFRAYADREERLPVDQHELLALIAPRPLYVASAELDLVADPRGEFLSAQAADPIYRLHGLRGVEVGRMPPLDQPVGDRIGYHVRAGRHAITAFDWARYLDFADRHLQQ